MTFPIITSLYAGILGLFGFYLAISVGLYRTKVNIAIYDGDNQELRERIRKHGNFTETVPLGLIVLGLLEMSHPGAPTAIYILGGMLVLGRLLHPLGIKADNIKHPMRGIGMLLTMLSIVICSGWLIFTYVTAM